MSDMRYMRYMRNDDEGRTQLIRTSSTVDLGVL